jgi:hypothetical protein
MRYLSVHPNQSVYLPVHQLSVCMSVQSLLVCLYVISSTISLTFIMLVHMFVHLLYAFLNISLLICLSFMSYNLISFQTLLVIWHFIKTVCLSIALSIWLQDFHSLFLSSSFVCLSKYVCVCVSVCLSVYPCVCVCHCVSMNIHMSFYSTHCLSLFVCPSLCLSDFPSIFFSAACLSICLFFVSVCPSTHHPVHISLD